MLVLSKYLLQSYSTLMEDFSFKFENIKEGNKYIKIIKIVLLVLVFVVSLLILIKIIKMVTGNSSSENTDSVVLIKAESSSLKRVPNEKGGLNIENLDIGVYDVIDDQDKDNVKSKVNKEQKIEIKNNDAINTDDLSDQAILVDKVETINQPVENFDFNNGKNNTNITINKDEGVKTNLNDLQKLGNNSLIKNLKNKKYIKPGIRVQLLAVKSRKTIENFWEELLSKYNSLFKDKSYYIEKIDLNPTTSIYRLQVGMFSNNEEANLFCQKYIEIASKTKVDCIVVK